MTETEKLAQRVKFGWFDDCQTSFPASSNGFPSEIVNAHDSAHNFDCNKYNEQMLEDVRVRLSSQAQKIADSTLVIACFVAHCDDEALGPGSTLLYLTQFPNVVIYIVVLAAADPVRSKESRKAAKKLGIPEERLFLLQFPDGDMEREKPAIRKVMQMFSTLIHPDIVIAHSLDRHDDHKLICNLTKESFAQSGVSVLHFRIFQLTQTEWNPNVFIRVPKKYVKDKKKLFTIYKTENWKEYYFDWRKHIGDLVHAGDISGCEYAESYEASSIWLEPCSCGCSRLAIARNPARLQDLHNYNDKEKPFACDIAKIVLEICPCGCGTLCLAQNARRQKTFYRDNSLCLRRLRFNTIMISFAKRMDAIKNQNAGRPPYPSRKYG